LHVAALFWLVEGDGSCHAPIEISNEQIEMGDRLNG